MAGASLEGCRTAVGSTLMPPPLLSGGIMLQQGESLALGQPPRPDSKTKTFPSPDKVLRLPAEMQLKQLIF